jgi:hypothetical protein
MSSSQLLTNSGQLRFCGLVGTLRAIISLLVGRWLAFLNPADVGKRRAQGLALGQTFAIWIRFGSGRRAALALAGRLASGWRRDGPIALTWQPYAPDFVSDSRHFGARPPCIQAAVWANSVTRR